MTSTPIFVFIDNNSIFSYQTSSQEHKDVKFVSINLRELKREKSDGN